MRPASRLPRVHSFNLPPAERNGVRCRFGPLSAVALIACVKSNTGPKSVGYPLGHRRMPFFWWHFGEAIGAFPHFARVFSSVAQSRRLVGERSCHASHSLS